MTEKKAESRVQLGLTIMWGIIIIPAVLFWRDSVPFLVFCSVYANFVGHWSSWEASKAKLEARERG